jgi:gas vesicle protein
MSEERCCHGGAHAGFFVGGALLGLAAGAVSMFFLAPRAGKESRKMVAKRVNEIKEYTQENAEEVKERVQEIFGEVTKLTTALYNDARKLWNKQVTTITNAFGKIDKDKYAKMIDDVVETLESSKKYSEGELTKVRKYLISETKRLVAG